MHKPKRGDWIFMVSDPEQLERQVVDVIPAKYVIRVGTELVETFDIELTDKPNVLTKLNVTPKKREEDGE